jgi:hypothetical protein
MTAKKLNEFRPEPAIKRVLRHRKSHAYFKHGDWTADVQDADHFEDVVQVAETCVQYSLNDVEVALRLGTSNCDVFCTEIR